MSNALSDVRTDGCNMKSRELNLKELPVYILTPKVDSGKYANRRAVVIDSLQRRGFRHIKHVYGVFEPNSPLYACAYGHSLLIETALCTRPFQPFLILEDDALHEDVDRSIVTIPKDTDAFFPSVSYYGVNLSSTKYTHTDDGPYFSPVKGMPEIARLYTMLTAHAVVILNEGFARNWQRCATEGAARKIPFDVLTALTQRYYHIYGQRNPWFYQAIPLGGSEFGTRRTLRGIEVEGVEDVPKAQVPNSVSVDMAATLWSRDLIEKTAFMNNFI